MAVAAAPTPTGVVHARPAEAGHPSPTAGRPRPTVRPAIVRGSLLRPAPEAGHRGRQVRGCRPAVHRVRVAGPAEQAHPAHRDRPAAGVRRDPLDRKSPVALLAPRLRRPQPYRWRSRQVRR